MAGKAASRAVSGTTEVVTAGTRVQIIPPAQSPNFNSAAIGIWLSADSGNTEPLVVGDVTVKAAAKQQNGILLPKAAGPIFLEISDVTSLWVDAGTSKDKLSWLVLYR